MYYNLLKLLKTPVALHFILLFIQLQVVNPAFHELDPTGSRLDTRNVVVVVYRVHTCLTNSIWWESWKKYSSDDQNSSSSSFNFTPSYFIINADYILFPFVRCSNSASSSINHCPSVCPSWKKNSCKDQKSPRPSSPLLSRMLLQESETRGI